MKHMTKNRRITMPALRIAITALAALCFHSAASAQSDAPPPQQMPQSYVVCPAPGQPCYMTGAPGYGSGPVYVPQGPQQMQMYPQWGPPAQVQQQAPPQGQLYVVPVPMQSGQPVAPGTQPISQSASGTSTDELRTLIEELRREREALEALRLQLQTGTATDTPEAVTGEENTIVEQRDAISTDEREEGSDAEAEALSEGQESADDEGRPSADRRAGTESGRMFHKSAFRLRLSSIIDEYENYDVDRSYWGLGLGFRYRFDEHWGFELTADGIFTFDERVRFRSVPILASGIATLFPLSPVSPVIIGGAGVEVHDAPWNDSSEWVQFVFQFGGGLEFDLGRFNIMLDVRRYLTTDSNTDDNGAVRRDRLVNSWGATVSLGGLF